MLGDPIVTQYISNNFELLDQTKQYILSANEGPCGFEVEVLVGNYGLEGLIIPKWLKVKMQREAGELVVKLDDDKKVEVSS